MNQTKRLERHFDTGQSLTVLTAMSELNIYALSQRCGDLRREGYPLDSEFIKLPSGKRVKSFFKIRWPVNPNWPLSVK